MNIVLGSGPASVFCALALLRRGQSVLMIDPGESLEPDRKEIIDIADKTNKTNWSPELYSLVKENTAPDVKGVPKKLVYGSDFPFRWLESDVSVSQSGSDTLMSHAVGGLSNAWGANILPLLASDTETWPVSIESLLPYYKKVTEVIPVSAYDDNLNQCFLDCYAKSSPLPRSQQATNLLADLETQKAQLNSDGIYFGGSRLAVEAPRCEACGLCLYGCPHRLIYSSSQTLPLLQSFKNFEYRSGWLAKTVSETVDESCSCTIMNVATNETQTITADKIFVGCGAVNSTALMLRSLGAYNQEVRLKDSQYFLTPFLRWGNAGDVTNEPLHTLSQVAVEIINTSICARSIHMLFYTYNDMYKRALEKLLGSLFSLVKPIISQILRRLVIMQGYLHSDFSGEVGVTLRRVEGKEEINLTGYENPKTKSAVRRIHLELIKRGLQFRGLPVVFMSHVGAPGKSYHLGGSFPMKTEPTSQWDSDILGRIAALKNIHIVDASIFPNVPAQNVTLTAMANAYRIGEQA